MAAVQDVAEVRRELNGYVEGILAQTTQRLKEMSREYPGQDKNYQPMGKSVSFPPSRR